MPIAIAKPKEPKRKSSVRGHRGAASIVRRLPDGMYELEFANGRRMRANLFRCAECQQSKIQDEFEVMAEGLEGLCVSCQHAALRDAREEANAYWQEKFGAQWAEERKIRLIMLARLRNDRRAAAITAATPAWVDRAAISAIYQEARARSVAERVEYHVDHIWPIQHPECCGLHVPWNLRVILATENCAKGNRLPTTY